MSEEGGADGTGCQEVALVVASFAAALLSELCGAALGFGPAILYEIFWQLCFLLGLGSGLLETAIFNVVVEEAPCSFLQLYLLRQHFDLRLAVIFNAPVLVGVPLGTTLLEHFGRSVWAKRLLGLVFLSIAVLQVLMRQLGGRDEYKPTRSIQDPTAAVTCAILLAMFSSGLLRGMLGIAGPPAMVLLLFFSADRDVWRCTVAATRVIMLVSQGLLLGGYHEELDPTCWVMYITLMAGGLAGLLVGNSLAPLVDPATFHKWLILFLVAGAMLMLSAGNAVLSGWAALLAAVAALAVACAPVASLCWKSVVEGWERHRTAQLVTRSPSEQDDAGWTPMVNIDSPKSEEGERQPGAQRPRVLSHLFDHRENEL